MVRTRKPAEVVKEMRHLYEEQDIRVFVKLAEGQGTEDDGGDAG